ncbi:relaxase/mobilization nuclease domain-containing protein [Desulfovibrio desulfuricans]|uniref:relaxase/mobilization nuclease domain-containing protein n=1 Tax=Desulfovibrio desulfuricans TaxID=876 RepID=UPI001C034197|nr:relaxase/mobilization nuclease domain-containing protein [Desulfovibrio desulfuricans]MBT9749216.1 relaxase/mobilization nuclease domain-containing protein [Desulfovibrio desulfuricans]
MIAKKLPRRRDLQKSCSAHVADIASYIRAAQEKIDQKLTGGAEPEKVLCKGALGFVFTDEDAQVAEMSARCTEARHIPDHWVLSWQPEEMPTESQLHEAAALFTKEMGLEGHHIIYAAHNNTQNVHLHLCISRVHPETGKVVEINKGFDRIAAMRAICIIEHRQGWKQEQNPYFEMTINGPQRRENYKQGLSEKASLYEAKTGNPSLERRVKALAPLVASATSWQDLHIKLADHGMTYEKRRGGAIIKASDGSGFVKASKCAREASLASLEKRFGAFEKARLVPKPYEPTPPQIKRDMNLVDLVLALIFRLLGMQAEARALLYSKQSLERAELRQMKFETLSTKWAAQSVLREEHAAQKAQLKAYYEGEAQKIKSMTPAELNQYCEKNRVFKEEKTMDYKGDFEKIHAALGAEKYLLTAKDDNPGSEQATKTFVYKPFGWNKAEVFSGYTPGEVEKVLPELIKNEKSQRFGAYFTPIPAQGEHFITVDDINSTEKLEIAGKFSPAMISESSPNSRQMLLKVHADSDPEVAKMAANRTAARINTLCGDPQIANGRQALRLPPFQNFKPKHSADGVSPRAKLLEVSGGFCEKAQSIYNEECQKLRQEMAPQAAQEQGFTPDHNKVIRSSIPTGTDSGRGVSWSDVYGITALAVANSMQRAGYAVPAGRRLDYAVACRLRVLGYEDGEAVKILSHARDWNSEIRHGDTQTQDAATEQTRAISTVLSAYHTEEGDKQHMRLLPKKAAFQKDENRFIKLQQPEEPNLQHAAQDQPAQQDTRRTRRRR